jgi:hypothetical protein
MSPFLQTKTFGMPRWAFLILLAGGVTLGLYLRSRRSAETQGQDQSATQGYDTGLYDSGDPGLAGVGVVSPPGGVTPVSTPFLPEGLTDLFGSLTGVIQGQADALVSIPNAYTPQTPVVNVTVPATGGGPPNSPPKKVPAGSGCPAGYSKNTNRGNSRYGQCYKAVSSYKGKKGNWHVYADGGAVKV